MELKTFVDSDWELGANLLHLAVRSNNINLVNAVLKYEVNIHHQNNLGQTALFDCENTEILKVLLDAGIDPNITNNSKDNALDKHLLDLRFSRHSNNAGFFKIAYELLPVTNLDKNNGKSLRYLIQIESLEIDLLNNIISEMKNLDYVDEDGDSFLHYAARNQIYWGIIELLIDSGVDLNIENNNGQDFYDLCYKNVQKLIRAKCPEFMKDKELRNAASKYNL